MTSKLVVNTIEADTGISSVSFASSISMNSTSKFHFSAAGIDIGADTNINRPTSGVLGFNINNTEKLRIDSNGHLNTSGIATASNFKTGSSNLHSTGLTVGNNFLHTTGINVGTGATIHVPATNVLTFGTNSNERLRIFSNGLVNIGAGSSTSGLSPLLHLHKNASNSSAYFHITNNDTGITNNDGFLLGINPSGDCLVFNKDSTPIRFATAGVERVRIDANGNMGLGDTAPPNFTGYRTLSIHGSTGGALVFGDDGTDEWEIYGGDGVLKVYDRANTIERLRIDSSGRLLIGTITEGHPAGDNLTVADSGHAGITIRSGTTSNGALYFSDGTSGSSEYRGGVVYHHDGNYMRFYTNGTERIRIQSDGDVDVATGHLQAQDLKIGLLADRYPIIQRAVQSSGSQSLTITGGSGYSDHTGTNHVLTDARQGAMIQLTGGNPTTDVYGGGIRYYAAGHTNPNNPGTGNQHVFYTRSGVDTNTERFRISEDGQLLLGETNPYDSNVAIQFRKDNSGNTSDFIFRNRANNGNSRVQIKLSTLNRAANADTFSGIEKYQSGGMAFFNGENTNQYAQMSFFNNGWGSLRLRNGNQSGYDVAHIAAYWGTSNGLMIEQGGPQSGTFKAIRFTTSHYGGERGYIGVTLGGTSYNSSSDYRMKQNVIDLTGAIDRVKSFKPKRFKWKEDPTYTVDGFLAHEASTVVPESVVGEKDAVDSNGDPEYQVMDNSKLVPVLTAALKEAIAKIETLETKVAALEGS